MLEWLRVLVELGFYGLMNLFRLGAWWWFRCCDFVVGVYWWVVGFRWMATITFVFGCDLGLA